LVDGKIATTSLVRSLGFACQSFASASAVAWLERYVLRDADVQMPGMTGVELHELLTARGNAGDLDYRVPGRPNPGTSVASRSRVLPRQALRRLDVRRVSRDGAQQESRQGLSPPLGAGQSHP